MNQEFLRLRPVGRRFDEHSLPLNILTHKRVGGEIHSKQVKRALEELIERGAVRFEGNYRWRRYWAVA